MKTLTIFRHAKSSWKYDVEDIERPLKKRGITDARLVCKELKAIDFAPDYVACSPARRTLQTSRIFFKILNINSKALTINNSLYDFSGTSVINVIKSIDDSYNDILIFGHNYALTNIVNTYGDIYIENVPTSGIVSIEFDITSWGDLKTGKTIKKLFPRDLK
ncbi:histidine phosphatase family protein [Flavobacteriaceae bacterium AU392]|nr:histidine phosphatase family protein [Flavobacteriaceae bacterium]RKM85736.1 histidine phosphatase family protein [Flavobacteriaceae bacterium AU392]